MEHATRSEPPASAKPVVPVFPLPNVFLFPGCVMPLHIFEPRYRQMIEDLLDRPGRLVMGTLADDNVIGDEKPALVEVGGLGEIGRHERLADGRFLIWLIGLARVRIHEVASDRAYRLVAIEQMLEVDVDAADAPDVSQRVRAALLLRSPEFVNLPADLPLTHLVDLLMQRIQLPQSVMVELFCECDLRNRAERALIEHDRRPMPPA